MKLDEKQSELVQEYIEKLLSIALSKKVDVPKMLHRMERIIEIEDTLGVERFQYDE